jgi:c-di-GMP-binding flagellar brake protein YcgR
MATPGPGTPREGEGPTSVALRVDVGDVLHLQPVDDDQAPRYAVKVIGYLVGESLLVTAPRTRSGVVLVREGQPFTARVLVDSRVFGFTTHVLKSNARPYPYLHLAYPRELESVVVRKAPRARADLIVSVRLKGRDQPVTARLVDISTTGARFSSMRSIGALDDEVDVAVRLTIGEIEEYVRLPGVIRREHAEIREDGDEAPVHYYGVEFRGLTQPAQLALYAYVYSRLAG